MSERRKLTRFPTSLFVSLLLILLLMSGLHMGLIVFISEHHAFNKAVQVVVPVLYWSVVAVGVSYYTRWRMMQTYD